MQIIHQWQLPPVWHPAHKVMLRDDVLAEFSKIGVTSLQSYLTWGEIEKKPGQIDFSSYDPLVEKLKKHDLKWVPFLLLGQDYATPQWFKDSSESVYFKCLQHKKESRAQSIWNPHLPKHIERFLKLVSDHYQDKEIFESILLGPSGDWGEAIYSAGGGYYTENFHTHADFWCADAPPFQKQKITLKDSLFRQARKMPNWLKVYLRRLAKFYQKTSGENRDFLSQDELYSVTETDKDRWINFVKWYFDSMTNFCEFWLKTARSYFPNTDIYLVTGGAGAPQAGADFSGQTKIAAKYNAGIRITNQGDNYPENFILTRLVSSAAKFYGSYYSTEGINSDKGTVGRLFDAVSSGSRGIYYWALIGWGKEPYFHQNIPEGILTKGAELLKENSQYLLASAGSVVDTAVFFPNTAIAFSPSVLDSLYKKCVRLREVLDFDLVDETMIKDGALRNYKYLLVLEGESPKNIPSTIKIISNPKEIPDKIADNKDGVFATRFSDRILYYDSNKNIIFQKAIL